MKIKLITFNSFNYSSKNANGGFYMMDLKNQSCTCAWFSIKCEKIKNGLVECCHHIQELNDLLSFKNIRGVKTE
jgi:hypothetical protein